MRLAYVIHPHGLEPYMHLEPDEPDWDPTDATTIYRCNGIIVEHLISSHYTWAECVPPWPVLELFLALEWIRKPGTLQG